MQVNDPVTYPAHGVGVFCGTEEQVIAGTTLELIVVQFPRDKLTIRVPAQKADNAGLKALSEVATEDVIDLALMTVAGKRKQKRAVWARRVTEYEQKVLSGDIIAAAEVVRDLNRTREDSTSPSYSELDLLRKAATHLIDCLAFYWKTDFDKALKRLNVHLKKNENREITFS